MLEFSRSALVDADVLLYVTDVQDNADRNADFLQKVKRMAQAGTRVFLVINKIDLTTQDTLENLVLFWNKLLPEAEVFPISAKEKFGVEQLFAAIRAALPECPPFFDKDQLTDRPARFFEKILLYYDKEIPYSVEVEVEQFKEEDHLIRIGAVIYVERESQKGIVIGRQGAALKKVGAQARHDIEAFFGKQVYLQLFVKVDRDWRSNQSRLRHYGYDPS